MAKQKTWIEFLNENLKVKFSVMAGRFSNLKDLELVTKDKSSKYQWEHPKTRKV